MCVWSGVEMGEAHTGKKNASNIYLFYIEKKTQNQQNAVRLHRTVNSFIEICLVEIINMGAFISIIIIYIDIQVECAAF